MSPKCDDEYTSSSGTVFPDNELNWLQRNDGDEKKHRSFRNIHIEMVILNITEISFNIEFLWKRKWFLGYICRPYTYFFLLSVDRRFGWQERACRTVSKYQQFKHSLLFKYLCEINAMKSLRVMLSNIYRQLVIRATSAAKINSMSVFLRIRPVSFANELYVKSFSQPPHAFD